MKVCIFGAGAVGGHIATRLINAGADEISIVARGAMFKAIRERGLTLRSNGKEEIHVKPKSATDDPSTLPPQDVVLVTVKAYALGAAAPAIAKLLAPNGIAVFLLNGIPWWFQHGFKGAAGTLPLLDPDGAPRENVEILCSHLGMAVNPLVQIVIADRLAQPVDGWTPFEASRYFPLPIRLAHSVFYPPVNDQAPA